MGTGAWPQVRRRSIAFLNLLLAFVCRMPIERACVLIRLNRHASTGHLSGAVCTQ